MQVDINEVDAQVRKQLSNNEGGCWNVLEER